MAAGYHEVVYDDGDQYKGEWNANGKVNLIATSCCLTHDFSPPQREGYGVLTFADGSRYSGNFTNGMCSGPGVLMFPGTAHDS